MLTALIDGDIITYAAGFSTDRTNYQLLNAREEVVKESFSKKEIDEAAKNLHEYTIKRTQFDEGLEPCLANAKRLLLDILDNTGADDYKIYITGSGNFREELATVAKYKGNRDHMRRPTHYNELRDYLQKYYNASIVDGEEADDALGIAQNEHTIICSKDKDLLQIPGKHYSMTKKETLHIGLEEAEYRFYRQALMGDITDNIPGIPGVGEVTAKKMLAGNHHNYWQAVLDAYRQRMAKQTRVPEIRATAHEVTYPHWKTGLEMTKSIEEYALEMARLVHIRTQPDTIWTPPC